MFSALSKVIEQFFTRKSTNQFPSKYMPESFDVIRSGNINSPIVPAEGFRGKPVTDFDKCTGCGICARVCPSSAIELYPVRVNEIK